MSEILSQLITPQVKFVGMMILVFIGILYVLSIIWVVRDAYLRGSSPVIWGIIALVPFLGCMIYAMLRPPLYASDREEQNIGILLQQRELMEYGECPSCGYPTTREYVVCPNCHTRLRSTCPSCGRTLEPEWSVCPYCGEGTDTASSVAPSRQNIARKQIAPESQGTHRAQASRGVVRNRASQPEAAVSASSTVARHSSDNRAASQASQGQRRITPAAQHGAGASTRTSQARPTSSGEPNARHAPEI